MVDLDGLLLQAVGRTGDGTSGRRNQSRSHSIVLERLVEAKKALKKSYSEIAEETGLTNVYVAQQRKEKLENELNGYRVTKDNYLIIFHDDFLLTEQDGNILSKRVTDLYSEEFLSYGPQREPGQVGRPLPRKLKDGRVFNWNVENDSPFCTHWRKHFKKLIHILVSMSNSSLTTISSTKKKSSLAFFKSSRKWCFSMPEIDPSFSQVYNLMQRNYWGSCRMNILGSSSSNDCFKI